MVRLAGGAAGADPTRFCAVTVDRVVIVRVTGRAAGAVVVVRFTVAVAVGRALAVALAMSAMLNLSEASILVG